ncbi:Rha family transcriptional regulator [Azospirillum argentinense]
MTNDNLPPDGENGKSVPVVFERDGRIFANSRDVADCFGKRHDNVLRDVRSVIAETGQWGLLNFEEAPYVDPQNGQTYKAFAMTKNGFTYLVQGYTGSKAATFKIAYIDRFDAMESALKNRAAGFAIPQTLSEALRLAADQADTIERQKVQIAQQAPKVEGFDRIADAEGSLCITDAAKALQVQPKALFSFMQKNDWIYSRPGKAGYIAYQDKIKAGYLEHKVTVVTRPDGTEKTTEQVRVTAKGLAKLAIMPIGKPPANSNKRPDRDKDMG